MTASDNILGDNLLIFKNFRPPYQKPIIFIIFIFIRFLKYQVMKILLNHSLHTLCNLIVRRVGGSQYHRGEVGMVTRFGVTKLGLVDFTVNHLICGNVNIGDE